MGDGAIVAAGSIVLKDVEPYQIVGGNPARVIRTRFDARTIERFQRLQWWRYDVFRIPTLDFRDVPHALDLIERALEHTILTVLEPETYTVGEMLRINDGSSGPA